MAIEFPCPTCSQLVRTPDSAAGKKGRCPQCQAVVQIPGGSPELGARGRETGDSGQRKDTADRADDSIEFYCMACGQQVRTPLAAAGKKGKCPHCRTVLTIPDLKKKSSPAKTPNASSPSPASSSKPASALAARPQSRPAVARSPQPPQAAKSPSASSSEAPAASFVPQASDPLAGLTPLADDPLAGLPPLGGNPLSGLAPLSSDPLAGLPTVSPLGIVPQPLSAGSPFGGLSSANPYQSPAAPYAARPARQAFSDHGRRGLAWEREPSFDSFWDTVWEVMCAPQDAFLTMRRGGGIGNPLGFLIVALVTSQIIVLLEVLLVIVGLSIFLNEGKGIEAALISFGTSAVVQIISSLFSAAIGSFIGAAILHVALLVVGGANAGFEATYRVNAFGVGAIYMLMAIPCLGPLFALVLYFVVMINGLACAHETSGGKAAFAVILPPIVLTCCICPLLLAVPNALMIPLELGR